MKKIILDLCGGTGAWSRPYKEAGYDVRVITLPEYDVLKLQFEGDGLVCGDEFIADIVDIYGVLAAPPCTMFSLARTRAKKPRDLEEGMEIVKACLYIIWGIRFHKKLAFWALENPMGYLRQFLGKPPFTFHPWEFGEHYSKKTDLWGYYNFPVKKYINQEEVMTDEEIKLCKTDSRKLPSISDFTGSNQAARRAITPKGFADAFFKANP